MDMERHSMKVETQLETLRAVPAVAGTLFSAVTLNEMVAVATLIYITIQIFYLLWKWHKELKK